MPNTPAGNALSRKIVDTKKRNTLKNMLESFNLPDNQGIILRTARQIVPSKK